MNIREMLKVKDYYSNTVVRNRILEYLGGDSPENATCIFLTRCDRNSFETVDMRKPSDLMYFFENGLDIDRSLLDRTAAVAHLDIEYVNFDFPAEPYLDPARSFHLQEPVITAIKNLLDRYGIGYLNLASGRGHHFVWQVDEHSPAFDKLTGLAFASAGRCDDTFNFNADETMTIPAGFAGAFTGMGLLMEYVAMEVKKEAAGNCALPVELTAVETGPGERGREMISIDISEYGDCPEKRMIRVPYSVYLKPSVRDFGFDDAVTAVPLLFMIPAQSMQTDQIIQTMRDPIRAAELADYASVRIPRADSGATENLIESYLQSNLRRFHAFFYSQEHEPYEKWPVSYDRTPLDMLPPCVRRILEYPNDLLLIPGYIQLLVRSMLALGWHPRHIAGLIRSKYERDHGWGWYWLNYDAARRADFYTRIFSGLFFTGIDDLVDFNCLSTQEKKLCGSPGEHCGLDQLKKSLLARRQNERLASRPFNRMFLPDEHI